MKKKMIASALTAAMITGSICPVSAAVVPNPVISWNCPVYPDEQQDIKYINDGAYFSFWNASVPAYAAYDLSAVPEEQRKKIIAVWYNTTGAFDYTALQYQSSNGEPSEYTIEINAAPGGKCPEDGWETAVSVSGNTLHSRQHVIDMEGYNWIRINITEADGSSSGRSSINFDIHNASEGVSDSWIFYGDSITACGMNNCYGTGFATYVNRIDERYFPVQENGGIGGILSTDGVKNIEKWLDAFPGKYVSIAYGTNDSWGNQTGAEQYYKNTAFMVEKVLEAGKVPIVPTIPFSKEPGISQYLDDYNAQIYKLYEDYPQVVKGPDFAEIFKEHPEYLSGDGVHPDDGGYDAMRKIWAETMYEAVYRSGDSEDPGNHDVLKGDLNSDGSVSAADLVMMTQYMLGRDVAADLSAADMNNDSVVNVADVIELKSELIK